MGNTTLQNRAVARIKQSAQSAISSIGPFSSERKKLKKKHDDAMLNFDDAKEKQLLLPAKSNKLLKKRNNIQKHVSAIFRSFP